MLTVHGALDPAGYSASGITGLIQNGLGEPSSARGGEFRSVTSREQLEESVMKENSLRTIRGCLAAQ